ncbi:hypothetical protein BCF46_1246 [Litoreibacter meonggei]|uniref:Uncharacterized protein n=1 Tax=Litoreibacter meonggei TaxID=1049199 RepID=A0A497WRA1_9RHOB|nr:hypothetical protein BCF46_1246 [Litoreibacter meonggei]
MIATIRATAFATALTGLAACQPSITESDAIFYGYCVGIYPHAEVAIQRGHLRYPRGTFQRVADRASRSFPAPVNWDAENANIFRREMGRGQNHGSAISRGDVQSRDITRLDACIDWANGL